MNIEKQIIDQRICKIIEENPGHDLFRHPNERNLSYAFLLLGVATYLGKDIADVLGHITEGGGDGGIDAICLDVDESVLHVTLFQSKYVKNFEKDSVFPANAIEKAVVAVKTIFDPKAAASLNPISRRHVDQIRSYIADGYYPHVTCVMINNGLRWDQDGQNKIDNEFYGGSQVEFIHFNHRDILAAITRSKGIDAKIRFSGKSVGEQIMYKSVVIGRVNVTEIVDLLDKHSDSLLERNVRKYLGLQNTVNKDISETLLSDSANFFFYNNGITMVCEDLRFNELQKEDWIVMAKNLQIINGGQTCRTIQEVASKNPEADLSNAYVLVRMYALGGDETVTLGVTKATNTQSPIDLRDLLANEPEQRLLEIGIAELGYSYKRKRDAIINTNADTITSSVAAEAAFVIWNRKPHLISRRKHELFAPVLYKEIFDGLNGTQAVIAVFIYRYCDNMRRRSSQNEEVAAQRSFSQFLIATMIGERLLADSGITKERLNHSNFREVNALFDEKKALYHHECEQKIIRILKSDFGHSVNMADGRSISAAFRRFEFVEKVLLAEAEEAK